MNNYFICCKFFPLVLAGGFSLESKWQQVFSTLLSILANLNNTVLWMVLILSLISNSSNLFSSFLGPFQVQKSGSVSSSSSTAFLVLWQGSSIYVSFCFLLFSLFASFSHQFKLESKWQEVSWNALLWQYLEYADYISCSGIRLSQKWMFCIWLWCASDSEVPVLEIWRVWFTLSLPLLSGLLLPRLLVLVSVPFMGQIDLFENYLYSIGL